MLEVILDISESLGVPTIAEGVENAEQLMTLKAMGCDIVQGYYFSRPLPATEFEPFMSKRRSSDRGAGYTAAPYISDFRKYRQERRYARKHDRFAYDALHDPVTGLYNASAYDMLYHDADHDHIAVLIILVNDFRELRKDYGIEISDLILKRIADALRQSFRSVDYICRISGNEFSVIMSRADSSMASVVKDKVASANSVLSVPENGIPAVSLSVGVAFGDNHSSKDDLFANADTALLRMRESGNAGCAFY